jgi:membrane protease YdiL (CAAX protease family)
MQLTTPAPAAAVSGRKVLAVLGIWILSSVVLATGGWFLSSASLGASSETPTLLATFLVYLLLPVSGLIVFRWPGLRDRLRVRPTRPRWLAVALLFWVGVLIVSALVYVGIGLADGSWTAPFLELVREVTDIARFDTATPADWTLIVVRALLLAGIAEELLFRGILFGWLRRRLSAWPVILITTTLFTVEHIYPLVFPLVILLGLALGWLREKSGSILPGLMLHILTDSLLFVVALTLSAHGVR